MNAVNKGETAIGSKLIINKFFFFFQGIKTKNGVVIAVEKKLSSILIDESSMNKTMKIDEHLGAIYSG